MIEFKDLTLREGAQVPGLEITERAGTAVIEQVSRLGIDRIELSFPRATPRESWYRHAESYDVQSVALARAIPADVDAALAVEPDQVEVIITTSDIQLEHALGDTREGARTALVQQVERTVDGGANAGVTLMDAIRADNDFLVTCARDAVAAGATRVTLADTTGAGTLDAVRSTVAAVEAELDDVPLGIHTHDDMGIATGNAATAVGAGATTVDVTVGGIGERAGNAPLEAVAVLLTEQGEELAIATDELVPTCRRVHDILGVDLPPRTPIIGDRVFRHESGLHTAAMLREPSTYEAFDPRSYGGQRELLFGSASGRGAISALLADEGVKSTDELVYEVLEAVRSAAAERGEPLDEDAVRSLVRTHVS